MTGWVFCGKKFTEGDVIQWTENIIVEHWTGRGKRRKKELLSVGEIQIAAQLLRGEGEWIYLEVREVEILEDRSEGRKALRVPEVGRDIRRKRNTVEKGKPRRLAWKDGAVPAECVRTKVVVERKKRARIRKGRGLSGTFGRVAPRRPKPEK